jgi:hypothetical protein
MPAILLLAAGIYSKASPPVPAGDTVVLNDLCFFQHYGLYLNASPNGAVQQLSPGPEMGWEALTRP